MNSRELLLSELRIIAKFYKRAIYTEIIFDGDTQTYRYDFDGEIVEIFQIKQNDSNVSITKFRSWELHQLCKSSDGGPYIVKCPDLAEFERDMIYLRLLLE